MAKSTLGITVCLVVIGACQILTDPSCMFGEEWKMCGHHQTCDNVLEYRKENNCFRGCFCKGKTVRNKEGDCVPLHECDKPPGEECPKNERFTKCEGNLDCQKTCHGYGFELCQICKKGCICNPGYVRRHQRGECIPREMCPYPRYPGIGGRNPFSDRHDTAGFSKSNLKRGEPESVGLSGRNYINEAMDMSGYAASGTSGSNTNDSDPSTPTTTQPTVEESENRTRRDVLAANEEECGVDEEWLTCGHHMTCDRPKVRTGQCSPGCFCKQDHVRNKHGLCIDAPKCTDDLFLYTSLKSNLDALLSYQTNARKHRYIDSYGRI